MIMLENFKKGWKTDLQPFVIERDAFAELYNAISDNGSVFKKRGLTSIGVTSEVINDTNLTISAGSGGVTDFRGTAFSSTPTNRSVIPFSVSIKIDALLNSTTGDTRALDMYDDGEGLLFTDIPNSEPFQVGTINYKTGAFEGDFGSSVYWMNFFLPSLNQVTVSSSYKLTVGLPATGILEVSDQDYIFLDTMNSYRIPPASSTYLNERERNDAMNKPLEKFSKYLNTDTDLDYNSDLNKTFRSVRHGIHNTFITNGEAGVSTFASSGTPSALVLTGLPSSITSIAAGSLVRSGQNVGTVQSEVSVSGGMATLNTNLSSVATHTQLLSGNIDGIGIKLYNQQGFINFSPLLNTGSPIKYLIGADGVVVFNGRVIFFGTTEAEVGDSEDDYVYNPLRVRYSAVINPYYFSDTSDEIIGVSGNLSNWYDNQAGAGGFITLDRGRCILFAEVINGRLILGLENGVAELAPGTMPGVDFAVRYFDSVLGAISPQGHAHLDSYILTVGAGGIISIKPQATLLNSLFAINRIDRDIVNEYRRIEFDSNRGRYLHMTRDVYDERAYINFFSNDSNINNRAIVYNYRYNTFSLFRERFSIQNRLRISDSAILVNSIAPEDRIAVGLASSKEISAGGTYQGMFLARGIKQFSDPDVLIHDIVHRNSISCTVTSMNHSLEEGEYVYIKDPRGTNFENDEGIFQIISVTDSNTFILDTPYQNAYNGGASCTLVENFRVRTAEFKPFWNKRQKVRLSAMFLIELGASVGFTVNVYSSFNRVTPVKTLEFNSDYKASEINTTNIRWFKDISYIEGDTIQLEVTLNDSQMRNIDYHRSCHCLHGIQLSLEPSGSVQ